LFPLKQDQTWVYILELQPFKFEQSILTPFSERGVTGKGLTYIYTHIHTLRSLWWTLGKHTEAHTHIHLLSLALSRNNMQVCNKEHFNSQFSLS